MVRIALKDAFDRSVVGRRCNTNDPHWAVCEELSLYALYSINSGFYLYTIIALALWALG